MGWEKMDAAAFLGETFAPGLLRQAKISIDLDIRSTPAIL
jgi:hypothetical protein